MGQSTPQAGNLMSQLGGSVLGSLVGEGMGLLFAGANNNNQANQQARLDQIQLGYNEQMMDYSEQEQLKMWQQTNYPAQVQQLEKAGLNPALEYGMRGGGGTTTGSPQAGISGAQAPQMSIGENAQLAVMSQQAQADINLKNAEADNIRAKTPQEAPLMTAQTQNLLQGVTNMQAQQSLIQMQTIAQQINNQVQGQTQQDAIASIRAAATQIESTAQQAVRNNYIDQQTMNDKIKSIHADMLSAYLKNTLTAAQTQLTNEQFQQTIAQISTNFKNANINQQNANTAQGLMEIQKMIKNVPDSEGIWLHGLTRLIPNLFAGN